MTLQAGVTNPRWSRRKVVLLCALPLPLVTVAACLLLALRLAYFPPADKGVDRIPFAFYGLMLVSFVACVALVVGLAVSSVPILLLRRHR